MREWRPTGEEARGEDSCTWPLSGICRHGQWAVAGGVGTVVEGVIEIVRAIEGLIGWCMGLETGAGSLESMAVVGGWRKDLRLGRGSAVVVVVVVVVVGVVAEIAAVVVVAVAAVAAAATAAAAGQNQKPD